jgi:hypothetical protein
VFASRLHLHGGRFRIRNGTLLQGGHIERHAFSRLTVLGDGNAGHCEDLPGQEETKTGVLAKAFLEALLRIRLSNTDSIVAVGDDKSRF